MTDFWQKAKTAARGAHVLLEAGDTDGAVSRAYYAMFDAARTALGIVDPALAEGKTHATVLRRFSQHVVKGKGMDSSLGRSLNKASAARFSADYEQEPIDMVEATEIINSMDAFLSALAPLVQKK